MPRTAHLHGLLLIGLVTLSSTTQAQPYLPAPVFGQNGSADHGFVITAATARNHVRLADGRLLLAGSGYEVDLNSPVITMLRMDPVCGAPDTTFAEQGKLTHIFESLSSCTDVLVQPDGRIVGVGSIAASSAGLDRMAGAFRFMPDGALDTGFNGTGYHKPVMPGALGIGNFFSVHLDGAGRIHAGCKSYGNMGFGMSRFLPDGTLDASYGNNGTITASFPYMPSNHIGASVLHADGSATVVARVGTASDQPLHLAMLRITANGALDPAFGIGGRIEYPDIQLNTALSNYKELDMVEAADGRLLLAMRTPTGLRVAAFHADGTVDPTYGTNGGYDHAGVVSTGLELLPDGGLLLSLNIPNAPATFARLTAAGIPDATFGTGGVLAPFGPDPDHRFIQGVGRLENGDLIGYGSRSFQVMPNGGMFVIRLTTDAESNALPVIHYTEPELTTTGAGDLQWHLNHTPIAGATANTHIPVQPGTYTVRMELSNCSYTSPPFEYPATGIANPDRSDLLLHPNPTTGHMTLTVPSPLSNADCRIFDLHGRLLHALQLTATTTTLPIEALAPGTYLIELSGTNGAREHLRFVKN